MFSAGMFLLSLTDEDKSAISRLKELAMKSAPIVAGLGYSVANAQMPHSWKAVLHGEEVAPTWLRSAAKLVKHTHAVGALRPALTALCAQGAGLDLGHLLDLAGRAAKALDVPWQNSDPIGSLARVAETVAHNEPLGETISICPHCGEFL